MDRGGRGGGEKKTKRGKILAKITFTFYKFSNPNEMGGATAIISLFECYIKWNDGAKI